jgi:hypothetical protein
MRESADKIFMAIRLWHALIPSIPLVLPAGTAGGNWRSTGWSALLLLPSRPGTAAKAAAAAPGPVRTFRRGKVFCRRIAAITFCYFCRITKTTSCKDVEL